MIHIIRPTATTLALVEVDLGNATEGYMGEVITWAMPDAAFWALLKAPQPKHSPSWYADMIAENPARMTRVEANGVGVLRSEKALITKIGLSNATLSTAKIPATVPVAAATAALGK